MFPNSLWVTFKHDIISFARRHYHNMSTTIQPAVSTWEISVQDKDCVGGSVMDGILRVPTESGGPFAAPGGQQEPDSGAGPDADGRRCPGWTDTAQTGRVQHPMGWTDGEGKTHWTLVHSVMHVHIKESSWTWCVLYLMTGDSKASMEMVNDRNVLVLSVLWYCSAKNVPLSS